MDTGLSTIWAVCYNQILDASPGSPSSLLSCWTKESQSSPGYFINRLRASFSCRLTLDFCQAFYWKSEKIGFASLLFVGFFPFFQRDYPIGIDSIECFVAGELIYFRVRMKAFELINCESMP